MADSEDDSMGSDEHFEEGVPTRRYTADRTKTGIRQQKDISNKSELGWFLPHSVSQHPSTTIQNLTLEDSGIETIPLESDVESTISIKRRGMCFCTCNICSSFHLQEEYNMSLF